jgi:uncharacterized protein with NRDE domain
VVAPLDRQAGGTWWGLNGLGVFAAITNRPAPQLDPSRRSRGQLVLDALAAETAREAAAAAAALGPDRYNPFNLFVADARDAFAIVYDGRARLVPLAPGAHVIGNADPDAAQVPKVARILARAERIAAGRAAPGPLDHQAWAGESIREELADLCRSHEPEAEPRARTCVHLGAYGTRSSTLLRLGPAGDLLHHADGPPCTSEYADFTPLLARQPRAGEMKRKAS